MRPGLVSFLLTALLIFHGPSPVSAEPLIASGCSVSNVGYLNDLAKEYERRNPGITIMVRGGGSLLGITELKGEKTDFAASCSSKGPTDPPEFEFIPIAWDALVFIVNPKNPIDNVTIEDIQHIYDGSFVNWRQLGGPDLTIKSYCSTPKGQGGVGEAMSKYLFNGKVFAPPTSNSIIMASSVSVWEQMVERMPGGFASSGFASARKRHVKLLKLNGVAPSKETIISGQYPLKRYLYLVINSKEVKPEAKKFVDFARGPEGQKIISGLGIPSLTEIQ